MSGCKPDYAIPRFVAAAESRTFSGGLYRRLQDRRYNYHEFNYCELNE